MIPIAGITIYLVFFTTTGSSSDDQALGCALLSYLCYASDYILLTDVQRQLRLKGQPTPAFDLPLKSRLWWGVQLHFGPRGVGWTHEPKLPPRPPQTTRRGFVVSQLLWASFYILLNDIAGIHNRWNPSFSKDGPPLTQGSWTWRAVGVLGFATAASATLCTLHCLLSALSVTIGMSEPQEWPHLFGPLGESYTVRRFWG